MLKSTKYQALFVQSPLSFPINNNPTLNTFTKKVSFEVEIIFQTKGTKSTILQKAKKMHWTGYPPEIIKGADKGGVVCVWSKDKYRKEAKRQLNN